MISEKPESPQSHDASRKPITKAIDIQCDDPTFSIGDRPYRSLARHTCYVRVDARPHDPTGGREQRLRRDGGRCDFVVDARETDEQWHATMARRLYDVVCSFATKKLRELYEQQAELKNRLGVRWLTDAEWPCEHFKVRIAIVCPDGGKVWGRGHSIGKELKRLTLDRKFDQVRYSDANVKMPGMPFFGDKWDRIGVKLTYLGDDGTVATSQSNFDQ